MLVFKGTTKLVPFTGFLIANTISLTGNVLALVAIPWFVLTTTHSAAKTGLTAAFEVLAIIIAGIFSGVIVDRLGYKRTSIVADIMSGMGIAALPLLYSSIGLALWQLLALVFLSNFFDAPGASARIALLPSVAEQASLPLERANAFFQAIQRGTRLFGAPLAGVLILLVGAGGLLWLDALTFAISALLIGFAVPASPTPTKGGASHREPEETRVEGERTGATLDKSLKRQEAKGYQVLTNLGVLKGAVKRYLNELKDGFRFIYTDRLLRTTILTVMISNFLESPMLMVIIPVYMKVHFSNSVDFGLAFAAYGGGAFVGAFFYGVISSKLRRRPTYIGSYIFVGLPIWVLAMLPSLPVTLAAITFIGLASGPINPIIYTLYQERSPEGMRGRVLGVSTASTFMIIPLGTVIAGFLLDAIGIQATLLGVAIGYLLVTLSLLFNPVFHEMDKPQSQTKAPSLTAQASSEEP